MKLQTLMKTKNRCITCGEVIPLNLLRLPQLCKSPLYCPNMKVDPPNSKLIELEYKTLYGLYTDRKTNGMQNM